MYKSPQDLVSVLSVDMDVAIIGLAAAAAHQICNPSEDEASCVVAGCYPGNCARFPIPYTSAELSFQARDVLRKEIPIAGYYYGAMDILRVVFFEPCEIYISCVFIKSCLLIPHLIDDVIDDNPLQQDDSDTIDLSIKSAALTKIDENIWRPPIYSILRRGRRCDLPPAAVEKQHLIGAIFYVQSGYKPLPKWRLLEFYVREHTTSCSPFSPGRDCYNGPNCRWFRHFSMSPIIALSPTALIALLLS